MSLYQIRTITVVCVIIAVSRFGFTSVQRWDPGETT